jgi:hypothetical protein
MDSRVTEECIHADVLERQLEVTGSNQWNILTHIMDAIASRRKAPSPEPYDPAGLTFAKLGLLAGRSLRP